MLADLRRRPRLATRLTFATLALLLPIYLILLAGYAAGVQEQRAVQVSDSVVFGQMAAIVVDGFRRDLEGTLLAASLALGDSSRPLDQAGVGPYLDALGKSYPTLRALFLTDPQGRVIASQASAGVGADVAGRPYIEALQAGADSVWSGGLPGLQTGQTTIAYARTVRGNDRIPRGFLVAAFQPQVVVERLPVSLANDARLVLVDERGRVLFASDASELGDLDDVSGVPLVRAALGGRTVLLDGDTTPLARAPQYGALVPVGSSGWVVGYTRPVAALEIALRDRLIQQAVAITLVMLIAAAGIAYSTRRLLRPLRSLVGAAAAVARGERAHMGVEEGDPDVLALAAAMDIMTQAVAQREEALRDETRIVDTLRRIGETLAAELDLEKLVQAATNAGTEVTAAQFGAFFYNQVDEHGEAYTLFTVSGASRDAFAQFPMPRNTAVFGPILRGEGSYLAAPVVSRSGEVIGALVFGHSNPDVFSERAERLARGIAAQAAVAIDNAQLYKAAQDAIRLRDDFLSVASHELRTPLAAIKGTAQAALRAHGRGTLDDDRLGRSLTTIARATDHVARLAADLLDVARLRAGKMPLLLQTVDLGGLLEGLAAAFRDQWEGQRELVLERQVEHAVVTADPDRLQQVFANLVDNAAKYSAEGSPVQLSIGSDAAGLRVSVTDSGIGVSDAARAALFQPFGRAPNAIAKHIQGLGLGLYICRQIVESHGGRVWVESPGEGEGSTFHVWLPVSSDA